MVAQTRRRTLNARDVNPGGAFVLYWMTAARRTHWNPALEHAVASCQRLEKPLLVLEALRLDYPYASLRLHRFVLDGMADNARRCAKAGVAYFPYIETTPGAGKGLVAAFAKQAAMVVTDDHPGSFYPRMLAAAARAVPVALEAIDGNGLIPLAATERVFATAHSFRRLVQERIAGDLKAAPRADPLKGARLRRLPALPAKIIARWAPAASGQFAGGAGLENLAIDQHVGATPLRGGEGQARRVLAEFIAQRLERYEEDRNQPDADGASGLSPYLHFGHIAAHEVVDAVLRHEAWSDERLARRATGSRVGFWGVSAPAEAFLDQVVTWRELGLNTAHKLAGYERYETLPAWARATLAKHAGDTRPQLYDLATLDAAHTHDAVWNAAQVQLVRDGKMHNYLRMLWGKKILEWSPSPEEAHRVMLHLNDRYALDGRDPNSVAGVSWVLGRYDRPWGPVRPIFGTIRYMSSEATRRKLHLSRYLERYTR